MKWTFAKEGAGYNILAIDVCNRDGHTEIPRILRKSFMDDPFFEQVRKLHDFLRECSKIAQYQTYKTNIVSYTSWNEDATENQDLPEAYSFFHKVLI